MELKCTFADYKISFNYIRLHGGWINHWFPNCLIKQFLKEILQHLKVSSKMCRGSALLIKLSSWVRDSGPTSSSVCRIRNADPLSGSLPFQITQSEFSRKLSPFLVSNLIIFILFVALKWNWTEFVVHCCVFTAHKQTSPFHYKQFVAVRASLRIHADVFYTV